MRLKCISTCLLALIATFIVFTACKKKPTLNIYCWADYISPELIEQFEKENGCKVVYDTFDSNEVMAAKLQAGATGYDIIFPSHYVVDMLAGSGKLQPIDHSKLACLEQLDEKVLAVMPDKECKWSIPYALSYTGIGYNKSAIKDFKPTWKMFDRADLKGRATLLDDKRETIGAALISIGLNPNSTDDADLEKAKEVIDGWKKNVTKFENEQYKNGLAANEFWLVMGYSGDIIQIMEENPDLDFCIPEEGTTMACDMMVIPIGAQNVELAYKFIDFIHKPENAAVNIEYTQYYSPNKGAYELLPEEVKKNPGIFIKEEAFKRSYFIEDKGELEKKFNKTWEAIKAN